MDFYKQEIYGNILYTAYRTRSLVVSVSLLYSLFGVAAILYFADKGYAGIIAGVIIVGYVGYGKGTAGCCSFLGDAAGKRSMGVLDSSILSAGFL